MRNKVLLTVVFLSLLGIRLTWADAPQLINFQGRLTDSLGNPVSDGSYSLRFRIYDDSLAGNVLWEETGPVQITKGLFTVLLGSTSSIPESSFYSANRWLGIKVGTNPEITPRQRLGSVGYAFQSGQWSSVGNNIYRDSGNVGIGTSTPTVKLDVGGTLLVNPSNSFVGVNRSTQLTGADYFGVHAPVGGSGNYGGMYISTNTDGWPFYGYSNGSYTGWHYLDNLGKWHLNLGSGNLLTVTQSGNVGIGTTNPSWPLVIQGNVHHIVEVNNNAYGYALMATNNGGSGIYCNGTSWALEAATSSFSGLAISATNYGGGKSAEFLGDVSVYGNLSKGGGSFKIDHPQDPANKYLYHSFVESPDMMNIYNGNVITDANGNATVTLPDWFGALNKDFRYQLTVIGEFAQAIISKEISNNQFSMKTDKPNVKVSWQVTGIRQDAYANAHRIPVEEDKPDRERGKYLYPKEMGQSETLGINYEKRGKKMEEKREQEAKQINSQ